MDENLLTGKVDFMYLPYVTFPTHNSVLKPSVSPEYNSNLIVITWPTVENC